MFVNSSTLISLRFFAAAARLSSFKRAAIELHVSGGAVSQHIKHLEETLGCKLFLRLPKQVKLTAEGERLTTVTQRALDDIESAARAVAAQSAIELRVRAGPSFALRWLVPRLGDFYLRHPNIKLAIVGAYGYFDPSRPEFDLAIEMTRARFASLDSEVLMDEFLTPVCSPDYLARHKFLKQPGDLKRCTLLHDGHAWVGAAEDAEWRHWLRAAKAVNVDSTQGQFFSLANMSIEAALAHQGVAMGRAALIKEFLASEQLVTPFSNRVKSPMTYCLMYPKELTTHPGLQSVLTWLREQAERSG